MKVSIQWKSTDGVMRKPIRDMTVDDVHYNEIMNAFVLEDCERKTIAYIPRENIISMTVIKDDGQEVVR